MVERSIEPDKPSSESLSVAEKNEAQLRLMEMMGATDTPTRAAWIAENSDKFRRLTKEADFRQLVRDGNFEEMKLRLESFEEEEEGKEAA